MNRCLRREEGQAAPLYITVVVGLLFLALLYFVFGKADIRRNEAQTAADAAALAAAMESRQGLENGLKLGLQDDILDGDFVRNFLKGNVPGRDGGCHAADYFAGRNGANAASVDCGPLGDGRWGFKITLESGKTVGESTLPGTESQRAVATATAVVEPLCRFTPRENPRDEDGESDEEEKESPSPGVIQCEDRDWIIDPADLDLLPGLTDLFRVRLTED
ncbi:hypothetical protein I3F58_16145 [Streptomyces sp. MUM 203J]|uniref:pilus assembly protein TadG-related protein n=1 Tax=Streptomyces sp. MUM 203J TaxID=2791990 RepID=UPI001F03CCED|nr:pilus assembly protein TadG-related protein [Streptomyces sp. MUM 203J]MCH0541070.1 hypothetical protein [Streptomyces sp. MUM 203J]